MNPILELRDVEIILRFLSFQLFGNEYEGNLKNFLDGSMKKITTNWGKYEPEIKAIYNKFNDSINKLMKILSSNHIGRKFVNGKWEWRFNKALFEVEIYYFMHIKDNLLTQENRKLFITEFKLLCNNNIEFRRSIEATTKTIDSYYDRFKNFMGLINLVFGTKLNDIPFKKVQQKTNKK